MRLIDADLLLSQIGNRYDEKKNIVPDNLAEGFVQMEKLIKEQPTAYDVDKVVEELETEGSKIEIQYENNYEKGLLDGIGEAIEIVKAGGIEMAYAGKCDRCGGVYDLPFEHGAPIRARMVDVFDDPVETKDLCPDCLEELRDFLDGAQLNDPLEERQIGFKTQADPYNHLMKRFTRKE